jgi:hypothetical protein
MADALDCDDVSDLHIFSAFGVDIILLSDPLGFVKKIIKKKPIF